MFDRPDEGMADPTLPPEREDSVNQPQEPAPNAAANKGGPGKVLAAVVGLSIAVCLMLLAFAAPAVNSGPHDIPLAVTGPQDAVAQVSATLEKNLPGAFDVTTQPSQGEVRTAIAERDAVGGLAFGPDGVTVLTASGAGAPYTQLLHNVGAQIAATGAQVSYVDLAPMTSDDPAGSGLSVIALPLVFGGMASAVLFSVLQRHRRGLRLAGAVAVAIVSGLAVTAILQFWLGSFDGNYWLTAAYVALGMAAISLTMLGLESWVGLPGLGLGALAMLFIANPLSGMATGWQWLPSPWGAIGQYLPVGATGTAVRSAVYFDGNGVGSAGLVLVGWGVLGLVLLALPSSRLRSRSHAVPS
ncbi:MAG: ABC transporter permease [Nostocoides sp.]